MYQQNPGFPPPPPPAPKKSRGCLWAALITLGALMLFGFVGCVALVTSVSDDSGNPGTEPAANGGDAAKDDEAPAAKVGDTVESGAFAFTVTDVETGVATVKDETGYVTKDADGAYVIVHVTVKNIGEESGLFESTSQNLHDADGKTYSTDTEAEMTEDAESFLNEINPGNEVKGKLIFDVPEDVKPESVELHDFLSLDSGATVDLT